MTVIFYLNMNIQPVAESPSSECPCCTNVAVPYHPLNLSESRTSHSSQRQGTTLISYSRRIQPACYGKYPWISVCTTKYKIFCSICQHAKKLNSLVFSKSCQNSAFITDGFEHWGKALKQL